jgi:hypothetical protein
LNADRAFTVRLYVPLHGGAKPEPSTKEAHTLPPSCGFAIE